MRTEFGTFKVASGRMVVSDPCYDTDTWCMDILPAKNGTWFASVKMTGDEEDDRVASFMVLHKEYFYTGKWEEVGGGFGVDSGQFSFVDAKKYQNQKCVPRKIKWKHTRGWKGHDKWYKMVCEHTLERQYGIIPGGAVSSSGYGDGVYQVFQKYVGRGKNKVAVGFQVIFIENK